MLAVALLGCAVGHDGHSLPIYQNYELDDAVAEHKGQDIYILLLWKPPRDLTEVSEAFVRFVNAIPLQLKQPHLALLIDPTVRFNYVYHWSRYGQFTKTFFPFRRMVQAYSLSKHQVDPEIRERLEVVLDLVNHEPVGDLSRQQKHYVDEGVQHNMDAAVNELANVKIAERCGLVRLAWEVQKRLDANLTRFGERGKLPAFTAINPQGLLRDVAAVKLQHDPLYGRDGVPIDEDAADYDEGDEEAKSVDEVVPSEEIGWWGKLLRMVGLGDDEDEDGDQGTDRRRARHHVNFDERLAHLKPVPDWEGDEPGAEWVEATPTRKSKRLVPPGLLPGRGKLGLGRKAVRVGKDAAAGGAAGED